MSRILSCFITIFFLLLFLSACSQKPLSPEQQRIENFLVGTWISTGDPAVVYRSFGSNGIFYGMGVVQGSSLWQLEVKGDSVYEIDASSQPPLIKWISKNKKKGSDSITRIISLEVTNAVFQDQGPAEQWLVKKPWVRVSADPTFLFKKR